MITGATTFNPALGPDDVEFDAPPGWHRLKHLLEEALETACGLYILDDVKEEIQQGKAQMWTGPNSVIVTKLVEYPQQLALVYWLAGGELEELKELEKIITAHSKSQGATVAILHGRRGWHKKLQGWTEVSTTAHKEI